MSQKPLELNGSNFKKEVLDSKVPVLVDFWAPWCGPCRMMSPVIDELAADYADKAKIAKVNVDQASDLAAKYGVASIPTLIFFKDGKAVDKVIGFTPKPQLKAKIDALL
jgi:thioredoxin 1